MQDNVLREFNNLDKDALADRMAEELSDICKHLGLSTDMLAEKIGMNEEELRAAEEGERKLEWSEYMGILFVLWRNEIGRGIVESRGLFPDALKGAMSINRNAHAPITESSKYGF